MSALAPVLAPTGFALLNSLPPYREEDSLRLSERLRADGHSPELVSAVLTQSRLRAKAHEKFGEFADRMLFTEHGLEQATRLPIAAQHARRFRDAGIAHVADLGCGIGGDALAKAGLGLQVTAVDIDPETVAVATVNLAMMENASAELGDLNEFDVTRVDGLWFDPARRTTTRGRTRRVHDAEDAFPSLSRIIDFAKTTPAVAAKLAPALDHGYLPDGTETQWVSWQGSTLEATMYFGPLARPGIRTSALVMGPGYAHRLDPDTETSPDSAGTRGDTHTVEVGPLAEHLYEPDGAVIRAGLLGTLARRLNAHTIDDTIAYLSSHEQVTIPFAHGYRVRDVFDFSLKGLQGYLRDHRIGRIEIKKRSTAVEPDEVRRKLKPKRFGDESATVILTRIAGQQSVIIADPH